MASSSRLRLAQRPDLLALARRFPRRYPFLLESTSRGTPQARYDLLFAYAGEFLALEGDGRLHGRRGRRPGFLANLDDWWQDLAVRSRSELPFEGGWFLFLGYELAREIEPRLELHDAPGGLPTALAARCPAALIWDHHAGEGWLVAEPGAEACLEQLRQDLAALPEREPPAVVRAGAALREEPPERFAQAVRRVQDYILAGDVFQVNLSREWRAGGGLDPGGVYQALRAANPAPFAGLAHWNGHAVASSSPERLVAVRDHWAQTRPIAGTRPRGAGAAADARLRSELLSSEKERAEHVMLIDLERNDLGRVCEPGTVRVDEMMVLETYAHVHHIVSNVRGRLRPGVRPGQVIRATFPGGTITGCPKVRCMEIIAELEQARRGAYTGSMGYLDRNGDLDLNILIRTLSCGPDATWFRAGCGIVADSRAEQELAESRAKARGLLAALGAVA